MERYSLSLLGFVVNYDFQFRIFLEVLTILGHGGWLQEGGRNRVGRGGGHKFSLQVQLWASGEGKGG